MAPTLEDYVSKKQLYWEVSLIEYLTSAVGKPFRPGALDCALFFAGAVKAMTGEDIAEPFHGKYRKLDEGYQLTQEMGFANHVEYVKSLFPSLPSPLFATKGDGAIVEDEFGHPALGIVQGEFIYVMGVAGFGLVPLTDAVEGLRI